MNFTINRLLAQDPCALEIFADYLEENANTIRDQNIHLFIRTRQHEERGFCDGRNELHGGCGDGYGGYSDRWGERGSLGGDGFGIEWNYPCGSGDEDNIP
jgi:hypothetical protein